MHSSDLAARLLSIVHRTTEEAVVRYLPGLHLPAFFAGHRHSTWYAVDLCVVLTQLHQAGRDTIAGRSIVATMRTILARLDCSTVMTFCSYRLSETLLAFGGATDNPLLDGLPREQIDRLLAATDSTKIYDPATRLLTGGFPNNYWCVLARCEHARARLGLVRDDSVYRRSLERTAELIGRNPVGFFDDDRDLGGRYDIYSGDVVLFVEPMWDDLGAARLRDLLATHVRLLETIAAPNGASVCWGRSIGAMSLCLTAELAAAGVHYGLGNGPRLLHLCSNAADRFAADWLRDGLIDAHRGRTADWYRLPDRLLQMTFDCLQKFAWAAGQLQAADVSAPEPTRRELFGPVDTLVRFDDRPVGVWAYRDRQIEFQLPVVNGRTSDYATAPHAPGLFDTPVDSTILVGVPRVAAHGREYAPTGLPASLTHAPGRLEIGGQPIRLIGAADAAVPPTVGTRDAVWHVEGGTLQVEETWTFDAPPVGLNYAFAEVDMPLTVAFATPADNAATVVDVSAMHGYFTAWSGVRQLHQIDFVTDPTEGPHTVSLRVSVTPALRVAHGPATHDYNRGLYDCMPTSAVVEVPWDQGVTPETLPAFIDKVDAAGLLHMGWPEHVLAVADRAEAVALHAELLRELRRRGVRIVWTMHNRRPHTWPADEGRALYRLWADAADAALHHSRWGEAVIRADYAFRPDCVHALVPHGHFGHQMQTPRTRPQLEAEYGLPPCAVRFGVLGRYQPEKQIELILQAFHRAARPDHQLLLTAYDARTVIPDDPRIIKLPRPAWLTRPQIAGHLKLCDALIAAQTGDTYLTSGVVGDGVGAGLPMVVPEWPFFREILGDAAVYHDNTTDGLARVLAELTPERVAASAAATEALRPAYDWATLAPRVAGILRQVDAQRP